jgi:ABC-type transport system substrate-binding protein
VVGTTILEYDDASSTVAQVIAAALQQIGIHPRILVDPLSEWYNVEVGPAAKRVATFVGFGSASLDPNSYMDVLGSWNTIANEWNLADYTPAAVDKLLKEGVSTTNPQKRFGIYSTLLKRLSLDVPYVPLYNSDATIAISNGFAFPGYSAFSFSGAWALMVRSAR